MASRWSSQKGLILTMTFWSLLFFSVLPEQALAEEETYVIQEAVIVWETPNILARLTITLAKKQQPDTPVLRLHYLVYIKHPIFVEDLKETARLIVQERKSP